MLKLLNGRCRAGPSSAPKALAWRIVGEKRAEPLRGEILCRLYNPSGQAAPRSPLRNTIEILDDAAYYLARQPRRGRGPKQRQVVQSVILVINDDETCYLRMLLTGSRRTQTTL